MSRKNKRQRTALDSIGENLKAGVTTFTAFVFRSNLGGFGYLAETPFYLRGGSDMVLINS